MLQQLRFPRLTLPMIGGRRLYPALPLIHMGPQNKIERFDCEQAIDQPLLSNSEPSGCRGRL